MEPQRVRTTYKTYKYKLIPTPEQARTLETILWRCRDLYNAALEERKTAWERGHVSLTYYRQKAELPDLKADIPEYTEVHSQVLQDVLLRLDRAFQAFFRRVSNGEEPGYPRFQGRNRYNSSPIRSTARAQCWMAACSVCRRLGVFLSACIAHSKARRRRSSCPKRRTAGMPVSPVLRYRWSRCRRPVKKLG